MGDVVNPEVPTTTAAPAPPVAERVSLSDEDVELLEDVAAAIENRLATLALKHLQNSRENVSFVINCRKRLKERHWDRPRQRRICAALEQRYLARGWRYASIYVMEHDHLRLRVTLRP